MGLRFLAATGWLILVVSGAMAQDEKQDRASAVSTEPVSAESVRPMLTGKERLGPKWTDEQRIDNCHVPIDKRGMKPRPSGCTGSPSS